MNLGTQPGRVILSPGATHDFSTGAGRVPTIWRLLPHAFGSTITGFRRAFFANAELVMLRNDSTTGEYERAIGEVGEIMAPQWTRASIDRRRAGFNSITNRTVEI
jgi:hypothetical protein